METNINFFFFCSFVGFKSYYVVWKLFFPDSAFFATPGLNRTMQYGNKNPYMVGIAAGASLNRTMQYGNNVNTFRKEPFSFSLNRTMQYGNP